MIDINTISKSFKLVTGFLSEPIFSTQPKPSRYYLNDNWVELEEGVELDPNAEFVEYVSKVVTYTDNKFFIAYNDNVGFSQKVRFDAEDDLAILVLVKDNSEVVEVGIKLNGKNIHTKNNLDNPIRIECILASVFSSNIYKLKVVGNIPERKDLNTNFIPKADGSRSGYCASVIDPLQGFDCEIYINESPYPMSGVHSLEIKGGCGRNIVEVKLGFTVNELEIDFEELADVENNPRSNVKRFLVDEDNNVVEGLITKKICRFLLTSESETNIFSIEPREITATLPIELYNKISEDLESNKVELLEFLNSGESGGLQTLIKGLESDLDKLNIELIKK